VAQLAAARCGRIAGEHADHVRHHGPAAAAGMGSGLVARLRRRTAGFESATRRTAQLQLDVYGELIDAFHQSRMAELELDEGSWALECAVLQHLADVWDQPDHGIWERRGEGRHYVSSKVMTWVAFDRGIKSAEKFGFDAPLDRWRTLRDTICREVCDKGFNREQNAFVESYGSQLLDASILLLPAVGFLPTSDPRVRGTIEGDREIYDARRIWCCGKDPRDFGGTASRSKERFLACTLWLADAYVLSGEIAKAQALFEPGSGDCQRSRPVGGGVRFRRGASGRQFPAGADPYRADQYSS